MTRREAAGFKWNLGQALHYSGRLARAEGNLERAESFEHEALRVQMSYGDLSGPTDVLEALAGLAAAQASHHEAARLFGAVQRQRDAIGYAHSTVERAAYEADVASARAGLGDQAFEAAWAEGAALSLEDAVAYAERGRGERKRPSAGWASLTPTGFEVVKLVAEGLSNPEIAKRLFITANTVKVHVSHVFAKLATSSRSELAAEAARRGI